MTTPFDHYLPRSILRGFIRHGAGVPIWDRAGNRLKPGKLKTTASAQGLNTVVDVELGIDLRTEDVWSKHWDKEIGTCVGTLRGLDDARDPAGHRAALDLVPYAMSLPYRTPEFALQRLSNDIEIHEVLAGAGTYDELMDRLAERLGCTTAAIRKLGLPSSELDALKDPQVADRSALEDTLKGALAMAIVAYNQWSTVPYDVSLEYAPPGHKFQVADCGVVTHRPAPLGKPDDPAVHTVRHTWLWDDEDAAAPPPGTEPCVAVITPNSGLRIQARFDPDVTDRADGGHVEVAVATPDDVKAHNRLQYSVAEHYVYGDPS